MAGSFAARGTISRRQMFPFVSFALLCGLSYVLLATDTTNADEESKFVKMQDNKLAQCPDSYRRENYTEYQNYACMFKCCIADRCFQAIPNKNTYCAYTNAQGKRAYGVCGTYREHLLASTQVGTCKEDAAADMQMGSLDAGNDLVNSIKDKIKEIFSKFS